MKLVSVIIPYFKKKNFINETIESVLNQTYKNLELILVYDDENQEDLKFLEKYCIKDKRVKIIINNKNLGAGISRNKGIEHAAGSFIAFIDSDDTWSSNKLEKQLFFMNTNSLQISHTSYYIQKKDKIIGFRMANDITSFESLLKSCDIGLSTVIVKTKLIKNFLFPSIQTKEDYVVWLSILKSGHKIYSLKDKLTCWKKTKNSLSSNTIQKLVDGFKVYYCYMNYNFIKSFYLLCILSINFLKKNA